MSADITSVSVDGENALRAYQVSEGQVRVCAQPAWRYLFCPAVRARCFVFLESFALE